MSWFTRLYRFIRCYIEDSHHVERSWCAAHRQYHPLHGINDDRRCDWCGCKVLWDCSTWSNQHRWLRMDEPKPEIVCAHGYKISE